MNDRFIDDTEKTMKNPRSNFKNFVFKIKISYFYA